MSPRVLGARAGGVEDDDFDDFDRASGYSRPRTKTRPNYALAVQGRVLGVDRGRFAVAVDRTVVRAIKARPLGRKSVVVGDQVRLTGDLSGTEDALGRIVEVLPRTSLLRRSADDNDPSERPFVANVDQLLIVTAAADPAPRIGMIDRLIVAAEAGGIAPLLVVTKTDLASPNDLIDAYSELGVPVVGTRRGADLTPIRQMLGGYTTVFVGHSGVGKSTLINALVPGAARATGDVNDVTGKGRHTSSSAVTLAMDEPNTWVIDTPGVRAFGLAGVAVDTVVAAFPDIAAIAEDCPRACPHLAGSLDCALDDAAADGRLGSARLASLRRILAAKENAPIGAGRPLVAPPPSE